MVRILGHQVIVKCFLRSVVGLCFVLGFVIGYAQPQNNKSNFNKGLVFFENLQFEKAAHFFKQAIEQGNMEESPVLLCRSRNLLAECYFWMDDLNMTGEIAWENLELCREVLGNEHHETARSHRNLAAYKFRKGGQVVVAGHFQKAILIFEKLYGQYNSEVAKTYEWLGVYYENLADTVLSRHYLWKALDVWQHCTTPDHHDRANIYRYIGLYYKRFFQHDSALIYFERSKQMFDAHYGEANFQSIKCLNNMADIFAVHDSLESLVLPCYQKCDSLLESIGGEQRMAWGMTKFNKAEYFQNKGMYRLALEEYQALLEIYFPHFKSISTYDNPKDVDKDCHYIPYLVFLFKARLLQEIAHNDSDNQLNYLLAAYESHGLSDIYTKHSRMQNNTIDGLLSFADQHAGPYFGKIELALKLYGLTNKDEFLNRALTYLSRSKALEQQARTIRFLKESDPGIGRLSEQVDSLQEALNGINAQLDTLTPSKNIITQKVNLMVELDRLMKQMQIEQKQELPLNDNVNISIEEIQDALAPNQSLLVFYDLKPLNKYYPIKLGLVAITGTKVELHTINESDFFESVRLFNSSIAQNQNHSRIKETGFYLYKKIFLPVINCLNQELIILPSPYTSDIPFEAFSIADERQEDGYKFMIQDYSISKLFSYEDFLSMDNNVCFEPTDSLLAIAPNFNKLGNQQLSLLAQRGKELINLVGTIKECREIEQVVETKFLYGDVATETNFKNSCGAYQQLHLATHGIPFNGKSGTVRLAFNKGSSELDDGWLNFYEILNLDLQAKLVVLSACRTGIGKVNSGEGSLNLAWAFKQAGTQSVLLSLWDVNDYASLQIIPTFYQNLKLGHSPSAALRSAKLDFIAHDEVFSHPYYWATFDYRGAVAKNCGSYNSISFVLLILISLVIGGIVMVIFRKRLFRFT